LISNIPSADELNDVALRLYQTVWSNTINVIDGLSSIEQTMDSKVFESDEINEARREYLLKAQIDLQTTKIIAMQSMEIALKARICLVSPFLLIENLAQKINRNSEQTIDFSTFKTIDAVKLPVFVNTVTPITSQKFEPQFFELYEEIRIFKNQASHLGSVSESLDPYHFAGQLIDIYIHLWPTRNWLQDRLELFHKEKQFSVFHDGRYSSAEADLMHELPLNLSIISDSQFEVLFKITKTQLQYCCHFCVDSAEVKTADWEVNEIKTAYLDSNNQKSLACIICLKSRTFIEQECSNADCRCAIVGLDSYDQLKCHFCGEIQ
jgi:hypothetical protein